MCERARKLRPDIVFGADIIAGFPTETEEMFENTMQIVEQCDLTFLHVFPYSERPGTPAANIPADKQVPLPLRKERAARLRALGEAQVENFLKKHVGHKRQVIVEKNNMGRTEHFAPVELNKECEVGSLVDVETYDMNKTSLMARVQ
jgi:threonylcarbamoyladenosine tRNA methylthiotransferase MtaB